MRTSSTVPSLRPSPGPIATASAFSAAARIASVERGQQPPRGVLGQRPLDHLEQRRLEHGQRRLGRRDRHVARVGAERGERRQHRRAGQARASRRRRAPSPPCTSSTRSAWPARRAAPRPGRARARARAAAARSARRAPSRRGSGPGATARPTFAAPNVTVEVARTAHPGTSPVEAFTPDGTSIATTGQPARVDQLDHPRGVLARRVLQPDAEQRVDDHVGLAEVADAVDERDLRPASRSTRAQTRPSPPLLPRRRRRSPGPGSRRSTNSATAVPARSISSASGPGAPPPRAASRRR